MFSCRGQSSHALHHCSFSGTVYALEAKEASLFNDELEEVVAYCRDYLDYELEDYTEESGTSCTEKWSF